MNKKIIMITACIVLSCILYGCKSKEVKEVEKQIDAIGDVTLNSESVISQAKGSYNELSEDDKQKVENYDTLVNAINTLNTEKSEAEEQAEIDRKEAEQQQFIETAKKAYDDGDYLTCYHALEKVETYDKKEELMDECRPFIADLGMSFYNENKYVDADECWTISTEGSEDYSKYKGRTEVYTTYYKKGEESEYRDEESNIGLILRRNGTIDIIVKTPIENVISESVISANLIPGDTDYKYNVEGTDLRILCNSYIRLSNSTGKGMNLETDKTWKELEPKRAEWADEYQKELDELKAQKETKDKAQEALNSQEPYIGMTKYELENCAWGKPEDINKSTYAWGVEEQWCYSGYRYVYLSDGIVTGIQE